MKQPGKPFIGTLNNQRIAQTVAHRPHATLVIGKVFENQIAIAQQIANDLSSSDEVVSVAEPTIEDIRDIQRQVRTKSTNPSEARVFVIHDVDLIKIEAQNALLKQLEEPVSGVYFVLSATSEAGVLDTIQSRCTIIQLEVPSAQDFKAAHPDLEEASIQSALYASGGSYPAFRDYLENPESSIALVAKTLVSQPAYQRMAYISTYEKDRKASIKLVSAMANIYHLLLMRSPESTETATRLDECLKTRDTLAQNGNIKLLLARLFATV